MSATAQTKSPAIVRPKYVRRQHREGFGGGGNGGGEEELSLWVRVGVVISALISRAEASRSLCRRDGRKGGVTVRGSINRRIAPFMLLWQWVVGSMSGIQ